MKFNNASMRFCIDDVKKTLLKLVRIQHKLVA